MRRTITASEGHILTNSTIYGKIIYLAEGADASEFYEITEEEYAEIIAKKEVPESEEDIALKAAAYDIITGVSK